MNFTEIKTELEKGLKTFEVFKHASLMVDQLAIFDKELKTIQARIAANKKEESESKNVLMEFRKLLEKERADFDANLALERAKIVELEKQTELRKEDILQKTNAHRDLVLKTAKDEATKIRSDILADSAKLEEANKELVNTNATLKQEKLVLENDIKYAKKELESIKDAKAALVNVLKNV